MGSLQDFRDLNQSQEINTVYEQLMKTLNTHGRDSEDYHRIYKVYNELLTKDAKYFNDTYARPEPAQFQFDSAYNPSNQMFDAFTRFQTNTSQLDDLQRQFKQATGERAREIVDQINSIRGGYAEIAQDFHAYNDSEVGASFEQAYDPSQPSIYEMAKSLESDAQLHKASFKKQ